MQQCKLKAFVNHSIAYFAHKIGVHFLIAFLYIVRRCCANSTMNNIHEACRVGKLALSVLKRFDSPTDLVSRVFSRYYGYVAIYSEPVQSSVDNLCRGTLIEILRHIGHLGC